MKKSVVLCLFSISFVCPVLMAMDGAGTALAESLWNEINTVGLRCGIPDHAILNAAQAYVNNAKFDLGAAKRWFELLVNQAKQKPIDHEAVRVLWIFISAVANVVSKRCGVVSGKELFEVALALELSKLRDIYSIASLFSPTAYATLMPLLGDKAHTRLPTLTELVERLAYYNERKFSLFGDEPPFPSPVSYEKFICILNLFTTTMSAKMMPTSYWLHEHCRSTKLDPFMQKIKVPADNHILGIGDSHGCAHSLLRCMQCWCEAGDLNDDLTIAKSDVYIALLGDYVDRGCYGVETLYIAMCLAVANPEKVFILRGNHEDKGSNKDGGLLRELIEKYGKDRALALLERIANAYDYMPQALFVVSPGNAAVSGCVQLCHAGIEPRVNVPGFVLDSGPAKYATISIDTGCSYDPAGFVPSAALANDLGTTRLILSGTIAHELCGFSWADFFDGTTVQAEWERGGNYAYGREMIDALRAAFERQSSGAVEFLGVLRGHQHTEKMLPLLHADSGFTCLWSRDKHVGRVFTTVSLPGLGYSSLVNDSFFVLKTGATPADWHITHWHTKPPELREWQSDGYTFGS